MHVWKQKDQKKQNNHVKAKRSTWGGKVKGLVSDTEKNHFLAQRAETLLQSLRHRFPGLPQTSLDMNKIQYNKVYIVVFVIPYPCKSEYMCPLNWFCMTGKDEPCCYYGIFHG